MPSGHLAASTFALLAILLLPLLGFALMIFFGKRLPRQGDWLRDRLITAALVSRCVVLAAEAQPSTMRRWR